MINTSYYQFCSMAPAQRALNRNTQGLHLKRGAEVVLAVLLSLIWLPAYLVRKSESGLGPVGVNVHSAAGTVVRLKLWLPRTRNASKQYSDKNDPHNQVSHKQSSIDLYELISASAANRFVVLRAVIRGDFSLIGAHPVLVNEERPLYAIWAVRPGLYSAYSLKRQANLMVLDSDYELMSYLADASLKTDLGMLLRSLIGHLYRSTPTQAPERLEILGVQIDNHSLSEANRWIRSAASDKEELSQLAFVNPDCLNQAQSSTEYRELLNRADRVFADGIGVHIACRLLNLEMRDNLNGTDLFPHLCELAQAESLKIYLLGGAPGVTDRVVEQVGARYPALEIAGHRDGFFTADETHSVIDEINASEADILLVAMGAPRQDLWIDQHRGQLKVGLAMGVGGLFDFVSQRIPRAPIWMREIGLEWVYRLYQEPGRMWRRYVLGNPLFIARVLGSKRRQGEKS